MTFRPALEEIFADFRNAAVDGTFCVHDYLQLAADGCAAVEGICRGIAGDDAAFEQLVSDMEWAVNAYIVPLDLTKFKVPVLIERFVIDPQLPQMVRPTLTAMRPKPHVADQVDGNVPPAAHAATDVERHAGG